MYGRANMSMMRSDAAGPIGDPSEAAARNRPPDSHAKPYRLWLFLFLVVTILDALITVVNPLLLGAIIDKGILGHDLAIVIGLASAVPRPARAAQLLNFHAASAPAHGVPMW